MADPSSLLHPSKLRTPRPPSYFFPSLLYKLAFFVVFAAFLPLYPSRAPEFVGQSISAGIWELLHLLVVGIAISYGLFSRRNVETHTEKEMPHKSHGSRSIDLQIPNVPSASDDDDSDSHLETLEESGSRMQGSVYRRNEPSSVVINGSKDIALPSPIPWRSHSGKIEMEAKPGLRTPTRSYSLPIAFDADKVFSSSPLSSSPAANVPSTWHAHKSNSSNPPPAPPPAAPPPAYLGNDYQSTTDTSRRIKDELEDLGGRGRGRKEIVVDPLVSPSKLRNSFESPSLGKTVRPRVGQTLYFDPPQSPSMPKRNAFMENTISISDDSDNTDESVESSVKVVSSSAAPEAGAEENEVDRKADEFIAKFREQIRQQRIESIKRSTKLQDSKQQEYYHLVSET